MQQVVAAIALGSNVGDRGAHISHALGAIGRLPGTEIVAAGAPMRTSAVGFAGQSAGELGGEYLNSCVVVRTSLGASELLKALHAIERDRGRNRSIETRWGARTLDLDLLVYGDAVIDEPGLSVPHPRMHERRFVLEPLAAIAPEMVVPGRGSVRELLAALEPSAGGVHA